MPRILRRKPHVTFACALYVAVVGFYSVAAVWYPMAYIWATYEDLIGEWIQFWSIVVAFGVSVRLVRTRWRYRWFFLLLALSCFYVAMEEISWGQRLFGFSSPEFFQANNLQGEMNVHNFLTGPFGTDLKAALSYSLAAALTLYGLIYPALLRFRFRFALWLDARGLAAPPLHLWPYFVTAAFLECSPFRFNEAEVAEVLVGLGLALTTVHYQFVLTACVGTPFRAAPVRKRTGSHRVNRSLSVTARQSIRPFTHILTGSREVGATERDAAHESTGVCGDGSTGLTLRLGMTIAWVLLLSAGTTTALYASPSRRARIDRRVDNGVEKFAGRYARHEQWDISIRLYQRVLAKEPDRVSILRHLSECAQNVGDPARSEQYAQQALAVDLKKYKAQPNRASVNRSLARTYRMMGDEERAQKHLRRALRIALRRVKRKPSSSSAAYSLGKTYLLMERRGPALEELSRAFRLRPSSKRYRRAYYEARSNLS